jgi:hypothetical protein
MLNHTLHISCRCLDRYHTTMEMGNRISWQMLHLRRLCQNSHQESEHSFPDIPKLARGTRGLQLFNQAYPLSDKTTTPQFCHEDSIISHLFQYDPSPGNQEPQNRLPIIPLTLLRLWACRRPTCAIILKEAEAGVIKYESYF